MKRVVILLSMILLTSNIDNKKYCDIKGSVNEPGVYEIKSNYTIQDIIKEAGGLTKDSYTKNINLSKKVTDEMVIYIFSKSEIKLAETLNNCVCEDTYVYKECEKIEDRTGNQVGENTPFITEPTTKTSTTKSTSKTTTKKTTTTKETTTTEKILVNINECNIEDLMKIKGLGEKKAQSIIEYREINGKFKTIEELIDVKGIGESLLEKIREYIKV